MKFVIAVLLCAFAALNSAAHATAILSFGQSHNADTVVGVQTGTKTAINAVDAPITISQIDAPNPTPLTGFLNMNFDSTSGATATLGSLEQHYSGLFSMTSGLGGTGTNYLSGTLLDIAFGSNAAFNLNASTPPAQNVTFTSDVIPLADLGEQRGAGFSFANVFPLLSIVDGTFSSFSSSASGTFSANLNTVTPPPTTIAEPSNLLPLAAGLMGLAVIRLTRSSPSSGRRDVIKAT